jgi:murein DD-endopeptidase MepM/ murein hydrolase activator NlpD
MVLQVNPPAMMLWRLFCIATLLLSAPVQGLELIGKWQQGGLILGRAEPGTRISFQGRTVSVSPEGHFILALSRDEPSPATVEILRSGQRELKSFAVDKRIYDIQRIEGVPQETVTPPPEVLARIQREAQLVTQARSVTSPRLDYLAGFSKPLEGPITGVYGSQRVYNGTPRNHHYGLDIAAPTGTLVTAPAPGVVRLVHSDMYFSGGTLIIDHGYGLFSSFIHLSEILVEEGQTIAVGDNIAKVGATGRATGPHLDWRINWYDVRVDPALVLEQFPPANPDTSR